MFECVCIWLCVCFCFLATKVFIRTISASGEGVDNLADVKDVMGKLISGTAFSWVYLPVYSQINVIKTIP